MEPLERAIGELQEQNYGSAIRTLEMLTARDPSNADAYKHLSTAYFRTGQREKAAEAAQRYVALRPTDPAGHYNVGVTLAQLGQAAAAERAFRTALSADPSYTKAREALEKMAASAAAVTEATQPLPTAQPAAVPSFSRPTTAAAPASAVPVARGAEGKRGPMPLPAKIAAGGTIIASLAILLWLFLPGGPANPGRPKTNPEPSPSGITTPPPTQPNLDTKAAASTPQPNPTQTAPSNPQPAGGTGPTSQAGPIFTPQQAEAVAEQMDAAEREQIEGQLHYLANWLRTDQSCKDPDFWPILQTTLATQGSTMIPGGMSIGTGEVMALITNAQTNIEAADNIEHYSSNLKSVLPYNVRQQIVQALALATSANDAYTAVQQVLQKSNTTLSQQALATLSQAAQEAEAAAPSRVAMPKS